MSNSGLAGNGALWYANTPYFYTLLNSHSGEGVYKINAQLRLLRFY